MSIRPSVAFYTRLLGFEHRGTWPGEGDPAYAILARDGHELHLSSHAGDGVAGQAVAVLVADVAAVYRELLSRGFVPPPAEASPVHHAPLEQSWGAIEFYIDDPDGNTLRFIERR